jgi:IS605 OrfB family transposase
MAYRVVKFPIKINQSKDAESIKIFDQLLELSTKFWNHLIDISNFHYNKINKTFHYENNEIVKHADFLENKIITYNQAAFLGKEFFKDDYIHSHLAQETAFRFANAVDKAFRDHKKNPRLGLRFPKLKETPDDYKSLKCKQYNKGYNIDYKNNIVYFNLKPNQLKFNFIGDDYHKNIIKNNKEKFCLIKKVDKDNYFLCVYIEGDFKTTIKQNTLNIQPLTQKQKSDFIKKRYKKLDKKEKEYVDKIRKINGRKTEKSPVKEQNAKQFIHPEKQVGIDPGCGYNNTLTLSNGIVYSFSNSFYAKIARLERNKEILKGKTVNSKSWNKLKATIKKQEDNIANARLDWLHKVSKHLVLNYDVISMEDFNSKSFVEDNGIRFLNKQVMNGAFGTLKTFFAYKSKMIEGKKFILINPEYTSQICSNCHRVIKKELSQRVHKCECGLCIDRDINSAINILLLATDSKFRNQFNSVVDSTKESRNGLGDGGLITTVDKNKLSKVEPLDAHGL